MRSRVLASCLVTAALLLAAAAQAGTLSSATWLQVTEGAPMSRTTAQLGATGTSTASSISVNLIYTQTTVTFFVPKTSMGIVDLHLKISQGGPQAITATAAMANGSLGVPGTVVVMSAQHIGMGVNASMFNVGLNTFLGIPISVGAANQITRTYIISGQPHSITVDFFAWTPGMQTFTGLTSKGVALPSVMAAGSFSLSAGGAGTVTLVSPSKVSIDGFVIQRRTASFTTLKLTFVPEPSTLLLLGAAAAALMLARRR
jgi:PEP-CTERM motif